MGTLHEGIAASPRKNIPVFQNADTNLSDSRRETAAKMDTGFYIASMISDIKKDITNPIPSAAPVSFTTGERVLFCRPDETAYRKPGRAAKSTCPVGNAS